MIFTVGFYGLRIFGCKRCNSALRAANGITHDYLVAAMLCNKVKTSAKTLP